MADRTWPHLAGNQDALTDLLRTVQRRLDRLERRAGLKVGVFQVGLSPDGRQLIVTNTATGAVTVIAE